MVNEAKYQLIQSRNDDDGPDEVPDIDSTIKCCCCRIMKHRAYFYCFVLTIVLLFAMISLVLAIVSQNYIRPSVSNNDTSKCTSNINFTPSSNQDPAKLASTSTNGELFPYSHTRLPQTIFPLHYEIYLHPNYAKLQTHGEIKINLSCVQATSFILIHAKDIDIQSVLITDFRQHPINVSKTLQNNYNDFYYIQMKESFQPDQNYNLEMTFISKISTEKLQGFYRASYRDMTGNNRYMYVTQFEAASARSAFPCFDEPGMKVTVSLTIVRPSGYQALSNMPIEDSIVLNTENNMVAVKFAKSVNMSTYLIAFAVVDYHYLERRQGSVHIRTWAPADKINYTEVALNASVKILPYYRKLFGIAYPLPKLDLIAVPDFSAGAMENWGLITFRETSLLYNPKVGTISNFERVVTTVAHELAHQWFGNLVTMRWWSDLWLNEGFASFVEYLGGNLAAPSLHILESLYMKEFIPAMQYDSYINSHPILQNVDRTTEIGALFDKISYSKGCCVLTMLQDYLNSTIFFNGLRKYLITYKYRNADSDDLWNSISSIYRYDLKPVMNSWTHQSGFPLITIKYDSLYSSYTISQERFSMSAGNQQFNKTDSTLWHIPIRYITGEGLAGRVMITAKEMVVKFVKSQHWIKANYLQKGYYRVNYELENWVKLIKQLQENYNKLSSLDRTGLLDDSYNLNRADILDITVFLNMTKYLRVEKAYNPMYVGLSKISKIISLFERNSDDILNVQRYLQYLVEPQLRTLGLEDKGTVQERKGRKFIISVAAMANDTNVLQNITTRFQEWLHGKNSIPIELKAIYIINGIKMTGNDEWEKLLRKYDATNDANLKRLYINALSASNNQSLLRRLLELSKDHTKIPKSEIMNVVSAVSGSRAGEEMAWNFVIENWKYFIDTFSGDLFLMADLIDTVISSCHSETQLMKIKEFFSCHGDAGTGGLVVNEAIEKVEAIFRWRKKNYNDARNWFQYIQSEIE